MAWVQKTSPPPNRVLNFSLKDFSGGMNNRTDQLKDNEGALVNNLMFADDTILETRYGQKYYDDKVIDGEIIFIDEYKPYRDPNQLIRATNTEMHIGELIVPLVGKPSGVNHLGKYYFSDGKTLKVYGKFTDENSIYTRVVGESTGYDVYTIVSPAMEHEQLPAEHTMGVKVVDHVEKTVCYEPCKNEFEDTFKGACVVPDSVKYVVSHGARLFVSGNENDDDNIFITDLQNPIYFAVSLPLQIPPTSDKITGLHVFDNSLIVGRENDIYVVLGSTNRHGIGVEVFSLKRLNTHTGFASHTAVDIAHNYLIFLGSDGTVYALQNSRTNERELATMVLSRTIDLTAEPIGLTKDDYKDAVSCFHNNEWHLSMKNKTLVYSYSHISWVMYTNLNVRSAFAIDGELVWGRPEGRIAMFDKENFFDFGLPYQSTWYSKIFDMDDANSFKQFREFFLVAKTFGVEYSDIYVTFEVDYAEMRDRAIVSNQISIWGKSIWGDRFINNNINESIPFVIGRRGRNIRIKVTNGYELDGVVEDYSYLENYPEKKDGLLVRLENGENYLYMNREWLFLKGEELNQRMKLYQINGDYELRGKR